MSVLVLLAALGAFLGFANPLLQVPPLVLLFPLALCLVARRADSPGQAFRLGWLAGGLGYAASLYWLALPVWLYGDLPLVLAAPCPVLVGLYLGVYAGIFSLLLAYAWPRLAWGPLALFAGCLWASLETAQGVVLTGFPWLPLASALAPWPWAVQTAAVVGGGGLSGLLAGAAALMAMGGLLSRQFAAAALVIGLTTGFGLWRMEQPWPETGGFSAALVQGSIDQSVKWDESYQKSTVETYLALSRRAQAERRRDLIVWPETAMPFYLQDDTPGAAQVRAFAAESRTPLLTGAPGYELADAPNRYRYFNRAFLFDAEGRPADAYDKAHLVPFGEYVPWQRVLFFVSRLVQAAGDFQAGQDPSPVRSGDVAMGLLICYETIFPELAQERVERGANVLVNISNDAWFGRSSAPTQHLDQAVLRAVEQGRWLLRATNTGVSALIDPQGRVLARTGLFETTVLPVERAGLIAERTIFHRLYGVARYGLPGLALVLLLTAALSIPRRQSRLLD